jgi:hypothetical protein
MATCWPCLRLLRLLLRLQLGLLLGLLLPPPLPPPSVMPLGCCAWVLGAWLLLPWWGRWPAQAACVAEAGWMLGPSAAPCCPGQLLPLPQRPPARGRGGRPAGARPRQPLLWGPLLRPRLLGRRTARWRPAPLPLGRSCPVAAAAAAAPPPLRPSLPQPASWQAAAAGPPWSCLLLLLLLAPARQLLLQPLCRRLPHALLTPPHPPRSALLDRQLLPAAPWEQRGAWCPWRSRWSGCWLRRACACCRHPSWQGRQRGASARPAPPAAGAPRGP